MNLSTLFAALVFLLSLCGLFQVFAGSRRMKRLGDTPSKKPGADGPLVSIVVPACNEEASLEPALRSLAGQDYMRREIIVIDDRSTDGTFALVKKLAREFPEIRLERVRDLPPGWLGKSHALHLGASRARGEILLFTDADVVMEPSTLSRAATYFVNEGLDHFSLVFQNVARGGLLNAMVVDALGGLFLLLRPWDVRKGGRRSFIGVGAFNMIDRGAYRKLGGHAALKMHPIDDIMLGKKVKELGLAQDCLLGTDFVRVRWYGSVGEMSRGLQKNIFALFSFSLLYVAVVLSGVITMTIVPVWGVFLAPAAAGTFFAGAVLCRIAVFIRNARGMKVSAALFPWSLVTPYITLYMIVRAVWICLKNRGIDWRGTHYPLAELKKEEPLLTFLP